MSIQTDKIPFIKNNFQDGDTVSSHQINQIKQNIRDLLKSRNQNNKINQANNEEHNTILQNYIHNKPLTNKTVIKQWDGVIDDTSIVYEGAMCWFASSQNWNLSELVGGNMTFVDYTGKKYVKMIAYIRDIEFESIIPNPDLVYLVDMGYSLGGGLLQTGEVGMIFYMDENGMTYDLGLYIFSDLIKSLFIGNSLMPSGFYVYSLEALYDNMATVLAIEYQTTVPNIKYTGLFNQKKPKLLDIPVAYLLSDEIDLSMYPQGTPLLIFQPFSLD